jgi:hypothetical protein
MKIKYAKGYSVESFAIMLKYTNMPAAKIRDFLILPHKIQAEKYKYILLFLVPGCTQYRKLSV